MNHFLTMLLAPECNAPQATKTSPPAKRMPARGHRDRTNASFRLMAGVAANAAGFGLLFAGCWFSLQLMHSLM